MKLRLQGSTLRLRLRRTDIETLAASGEVREVVSFPQGRWFYSLVLDNKVASPSAEMHGNEICVRLPRQQGLAWCHSTEVAISNSAAMPAVLVERDFVRTAVEETDDFDRFTNPRSGRKPPPAPPASTATN
ncbi:MAG: hypothetical protein JNK87_31020 [Bryobacterales bacterium]|nr:hypothetical protein [Bryobacterales bacterium]